MADRPPYAPDWTPAQRLDYAREYLAGEPVETPMAEHGDGECAHCDALRRLRDEASEMPFETYCTACERYSPDAEWEQSDVYVNDAEWAESYVECPLCHHHFPPHDPRSRLLEET